MTHHNMTAREYKEAMSSLITMCRLCSGHFGAPQLGLPKHVYSFSFKHTDALSTSRGLYVHVTVSSKRGIKHAAFAATLLTRDEFEHSAEDALVAQADVVDLFDPIDMLGPANKDRALLGLFNNGLDFAEPFVRLAREVFKGNSKARVR